MSVAGHRNVETTRCAYSAPPVEGGGGGPVEGAVGWVVIGSDSKV